MQSVALSACTTLVSLEPRLPMETRNRVMKVCMDMLQHNKTMLIVCVLLEEHLYCFDLLYIPLSGNIRFFCIANRALKHCWESHHKPHYSIRCHSAYKVMLLTYISIVLSLFLDNVSCHAVNFFCFFIFLCYLLCLSWKANFLYFYLCGLIKLDRRGKDRSHGIALRRNLSQASRENPL